MNRLLLEWLWSLMKFLAFPVTPGAVDVLGGRQCAPGDVLVRPQHPLKSPVVLGGAVAVPGGDTARQDALNGASVKVCECRRG